MLKDISGIIINNKLIPIDEAVEFCQAQISSSEKKKWEKDVYQFIADFFDDSDIVIQKTSGTTGPAKEYALKKSAMVASAQITLDYLEIPVVSNALLCLPVDYIAGKMMIVRAIVGQLNLLLVEPSGIPVLNTRQNIALCAMVPMQAFNIFNNYDMLQSLEVLLIGGAELRPELEEMLQSINIRVYETFGMTETYSHIALRKISGDDKEDCFIVLGGVEIKTDNRNCLVVKTEYLEDEVVTNDIVELIDSKHFKWRGRYDNLINSGGKKIHPEVIEKQLEYQLLFPTAILGLEDEILGHKVVLVTEKKYCHDKEILEKRLREILPPHYVPKEIILVDEIPHSDTFKIDRKKLIEMIGNE